MGFLRLVYGLTALAGTVYSQFPQVVTFCDPLTTICYASYTSELGIAYRVALPNVTDETIPTDAILQIVAPISTGWSAFAWGGQMLGNPLSVGWSTGSGLGAAMISSRYITTPAYPRPYAEAEYTYLKGTGTNKTHWTVTVRCRGCTSWQNANGTNTTISPTGTTTFAWAMASAAPQTPKLNSSTFTEPDNVNQWQHNMDYARSPLFDAWVVDNLLPSTRTGSIGHPSSTPSHWVSSATAAVRTVDALPPRFSDRKDGSIMGRGIANGAMPTACAGVPAPQYPIQVATGWAAIKVKGGMISARGIVFDTAGNLLVVESGKGITAHTLASDGSGCIASSKTLIKQNNLNHGIFLNGTTLYASSMTTVWSWTYDPKAIAVGTTKTVVITGMYPGGHPTRSLIIPPNRPNLLVVSHGSNDNFDFASGNIKTARSNIKVFDVSTVPSGGYNYVSGGYTAGYGLRNEVGLTFDPNNKLWGVENSSDDVKRTINGIDNDLHTDNPADVLHYLGDVSSSDPIWYGYPTCYTVWNPSSFQDKIFSIGDQFVLAPNNSYSDVNCTAQSTPARLSFQAHSAPLDCKFDSTYKNMYVTFHGSYDRSQSTGYKLVSIPFAKDGFGNYAPVAPANSGSGYTDIWWNPNVTSCGSIQCFRPVSIVMDSADRMYVTSDAAVEGELWLVGRV